jgi:hypothetical protein
MPRQRRADAVINEINDPGIMSPGRIIARNDMCTRSIDDRRLGRRQMRDDRGSRRGTHHLMGMLRCPSERRPIRGQPAKPEATRDRLEKRPAGFVRIFHGVACLIVVVDPKNRPPFRQAHVALKNFSG